MERVKVGMSRVLERIDENQQATCEVAMSVSFQFERERLLSVRQPNFPADNSLDAIVDLTADHAIVNSERHRTYYKDKLKAES
jgi:hypothetical protein